MTDRRSALIVSGSLGGGHDALAASCATLLESCDIDVRTVDAMASLGQDAGVIGEWVFRGLMAVTPVYDAWHFGPLRRGGRLVDLAERTAVRRVYEAVAPPPGEPPLDLGIAVFATAVGALGRLRAEGACRRVVVFLPDACAHSMWVDEHVDLYLVTSGLGAATVRRYHPTANVQVVSPLVDVRFSHAPSKAAARSSLDLAADAKCVLLLAGAWGIGPLDELALDLAGAGYHVVAVAGRNVKLLERLRSAASRHGAITAVGFSSQMPTLMAASDVVVTTSGTTCHEARAVGRRLVILDVIPGHGRENVIHQLEVGGAAVSDARPAAVVQAVGAALAAPDAPESCRSGPPSGATAVLDALREIGVPLP